MTTPPITTDPARKALEEGATEAWAVRNLDRYIDELGLEDVVPGIKSVTEISRYQHYMPAADVLAERIGDQPGVGRDEVLRQMNCALSGTAPAGHAVTQRPSPTTLTKLAPTNRTQRGPQLQTPNSHDPR